MSGLCLLGDEAGDAPLVPDGMTPVRRWNIVATSGQANLTTEITTTLSGNTIVVGVETGAAASAEKVTDDGGNVYQLVPLSRAVNDEKDNAIEVWIAGGANAGAKKVTAVGVIHSVVVWEIENIDPDPVTVDTRSNQATSETPKGVGVTTTEQGQFVLSILVVANFIDGLTPNSAFTNDHSTFGNGWAHLTDDGAPPGEYQPEWSQPGGGTSCASSVVFRVAD